MSAHKRTERLFKKAENLERNQNQGVEGSMKDKAHECALAILDDFTVGSFFTNPSEGLDRVDFERADAADIADIIRSFFPQESPCAVTIEPADPPMSKESTNDLSFLD